METNPDDFYKPGKKALRLPGLRKRPKIKNPPAPAPPQPKSDPVSPKSEAAEQKISEELTENDSLGG